MVNAEQNSDPSKYNGLSSTVCKGRHYILHHELCKKNLCYNNVEKEETTYTVPSTKLCPKQKSMAPCAILCTMQFVIPLLLTFCPLWIKKLHVLLFLVELKPRI
jgi:hypothetical protein